MSRRVELMPAPLAAPFGRMQAAPLPSQKTWMGMMDGYDGTVGGQVRTSGQTDQDKDQEEKKEREDGQEEASH